MLYFVRGQSEVTYGHVVLLQGSYSKNQVLFKDFLRLSYINGWGKIRPLAKSAYQTYDFSYFSTKKFVVGTQKNRCNEKDLLST